jgi:hypothetical protein
MGLPSKLTTPWTSAPKLLPKQPAIVLQTTTAAVPYHGIRRKEFFILFRDRECGPGSLAKGPEIRRIAMTSRVIRSR